MTALERKRRFRSKLASVQRVAKHVIDPTLPPVRAKAHVPRLPRLLPSAGPPKLELSPYTVEIMQLEVQNLWNKDDKKNDVTLGQIWETWRGSADVRRIHVATFGHDDVWVTKNSTYKRAYELMDAWERMFEDIIRTHFRQTVQDWNQVRQRLLEPYFVWEQESLDALPARTDEASLSAPNASSLARKYLQKFRQITEASRSNMSLVGTRAWERLAAYRSSHRVTTEDEEEEPTDPADRMWFQNLQQRYQDRFKRIQTAGFKASLERLERLERQEEAESKARSLLRPFTDDETGRVRQALGSGDPTEVLCRFDTDYITRQNMQTLRPGCWLSDEVIHFFLAMLAQRDQDLCAADPGRKRSHFFKSFFMTKLLNEGHATQSGVYEYRNVKRWSKKVPGKDIFNLDKIVFPINVNRSHWVCVVAFMQEKKIQFYDSMGDDGMEFLQAVFRYIQDEHLDKKKKPLPDVDQWQLVPCTNDTPQQLNLVDCGVFTCMFADFVTKNCPLLFGQEHINQCRQRIALSILQGKAIM